MREMKDSGIEWIGEIPAEWNKHPVYCYFEERKHGNWKGKEKNLLSLSYGKIIRKDINTNEGLLPENFNTYNTVESGDIIIRPTDLQNDKRSLRTGLVKERGIITSAYIALMPKKNVNSAYFYYLLHAYDVSKVFYNMGNGVRQGLNYATFSRLMVFEPPLAEQKAIADFLDAKCAEIDSLSADIRTQIDTLTQYKKSVITEAVTKGLNTDAEMKDSGIPWIGEIPRAWTVMRLKYLATLLDECRKPITADKRNQNAEVLYDYYGASGVIDVIDGYTIDDHVMLIGEDGANLLLRNLPLIYEVNGKAWINNHAHILKPKKKMVFKFLFHTLESSDIKPYITGSTQPKLNQENLLRISLPVPSSLAEQQAIADFLDAKCAEIDGIVSTKQEQLSTLAEYKKSLIYEYATGKKEARGKGEA